MQVQHIKGIRVVNIGPGEHYTSAKPEIIKTLLGSCVAVCLFDPVSNLIGMNHFLLAKDKLQRSGLRDPRAGYYGVHAMELLINSLVKLGAKKSRLKAKVFGGANVLKTLDGNIPNHYDVGNLNVDFALAFLTRERIPIVASDVRGTTGRVIYFDPGDFSVYRNDIESPDDTDQISQTETLGRKTEAQPKLTKIEILENWLNEVRDS
jgi:chemotaxis protein CheD